MVIEARPRTTGSIIGTALRETSKTKITLFHCFNATDGVRIPEYSNVDIETISLPCSSLNRETVLLKAFEAGADAVIFLVCPRGACRHIDGNLRAIKRVDQVKKILDAAGIDGRRLNWYSIPVDDREAVSRAIDSTLSWLAVLGPSPARQF